METEIRVLVIIVNLRVLYPAVKGLNKCPPVVVVVVVLVILRRTPLQ